ncbi:MAG: peptidoglycan-binding domain-containing protein, partial [Bryobacteraceae bacterium]
MQVDDIKLLHPYLQQLGYSIPENEINNTLYGTGTAEAVAAFQTKSGLQPTGEVDAATAKAINIAVAALQPDTEPKPDPDKQPNGSLVRGYVRQVDGAPVIGTIVRAYDKDLPSLQRDTPLGELLGETTTDPDGAYAIPYTAEQFSRAEKDSADLVVRAFHGSGGAIAESAVLFNAPPEAQVDLVTKSDGMGLSEYRRFLITVAPLINNIPVADLTTEDVDFLTGETGLDRQFLSFLVIAHRHATTAESAVDAAVFYGLMRAALPVELLLLLAQGPEVQRDALKRAVAENIIPAYVTNNLEVILAQLKALRVRFALQPPGQEQPAPLGV